jgi:hypothetical protein
VVEVLVTPPARKELLALRSFSDEAGGRTMRIVPLPLLLAVLALALAPEPRPPDNTAALIEQLAEVSRVVDSNVAERPGYFRPYFAPLDPPEESFAVYVRQRGPQPPEVMRDLVKQGAAAVPQLIAHLDDRRATCIRVWSRDFFGNRYHSKFSETIDTKHGPPPPPLDPPQEPDLSPYTVTVGDLCFVALGQIVNRDFIAVRGPDYPTINTLAYAVTITSPTHSPSVLAAVRAGWRRLTPARHRAALIDDLLHPDTPRRQAGACRRIGYYYPADLPDLVLPLLRPVNVNADTAALIEDGLLHDRSVAIDRAVRELLVTTADHPLALACMRRLLGRGYDAEIERACVQRDREEFRDILTCLGWTPAHVAVARQDADSLRELTHLEERDRLGRTPVELAAELGHTDLVRLLVARGCGVSNPLIAASAGTIDQLRDLLRADPVALPGHRAG